MSFILLSGASEGILVWYGQPSEVQLTRGGVVAETKILEFYTPDQCILLTHGYLGQKVVRSIP